MESAMKLSWMRGRPSQRCLVPQSNLHPCHSARSGIDPTGPDSLFLKPRQTGDSAPRLAAVLGQADRGTSGDWGSSDDRSIMDMGRPGSFGFLCRFQHSRLVPPSLVVSSKGARRRESPPQKVVSQEIGRVRRRELLWTPQIPLYVPGVEEVRRERSLLPSYRGC
jgi:hypothetical protein